MEALGETLAEDGAILTISGPNGKRVTIGDVDPLYQQAVEIVKSSGGCSVSRIQRQLRISYNRAARLVETMEAAGVVSIMDASGNRNVLANTKVTGRPPADGGESD